MSQPAVHGYVVNLRRRSDRRRYMMDILPEDLQVTFTSDWDGPFDGAELDLFNLPGAFDVYKNWRLPFSSGHKYWDRALRPGEVGCTLSHFHVWQHIAQADAPCLILEDDVRLAPSVTNRCLELINIMEAPEGPGLIYLGRSMVGPEPMPQSGLVHSPGFSYGSFGYMLTPRAANTFLETPIATHLIPVDEFLPAMYMDHPRPDIRMLFPKTTTAAATVPAVVTTDLSMGSDSEGDSGF